MGFALGSKVLVDGFEDRGFAEVCSYPDAEKKIEVVYYTSPQQYSIYVVPIKRLKRNIPLPCQTRCYFREDGAIKVGRVIECCENKKDLRKYLIKFPNQFNPISLNENEFNVRSYLASADPVQTLASLGHETPFFFESRSHWVSALNEQLRLSHGQTGLISSRVRLMPHQVEVVRRVLQDPVMRYLLADEVGLGKTIEAGIILHQIALDFPEARIIVYTPHLLCEQWRQELENRFELIDIEVLPHEDLTKLDSEHLDMVVIDEAHHVVATTTSGKEQKKLFQAACTIAQRTRHLLLLSATPVLYHEEELLGLLHLLDPLAYRFSDLASFRERLELRKEVGRALMALSSARQPILVQRHAARLSSVLANDEEVDKLARQIKESFATKDNEAALRASATLQIHISETYRVYRRMLRTRRKLLGDSGIITIQRVGRAIEYELNEEILTTLWNLLEEWRIHAAIHASKVSLEEKYVWIERYLELAYFLSSSPLNFTKCLQSRLLAHDLVDFEVGFLTQMLEAAQTTTEEASNRIDLLGMILQNRSRHNTGSKYVVFCSRPETCEEIVERLKTLFTEPEIAAVHCQMNQALAEENLELFRDNESCKFLIADATVEEGRNLQFASGIIMYDLPWDPMRIEQRLGRLDRIDRNANIPCWVILTSEDESVALDTAWHEIINEGFGVFSGSISDLQFVVEKEMMRLKNVAFEGGPSALIEEVASVRDNITKERELANEQDIIDGIHLGEILESQLWKDLQLTETKAVAFGEALSSYLQGNLGIVRQRNGSTFRFQRNRENPNLLIPTDRLLYIAGLSEPSTVDRETAIRRMEIQFLRPGQSLIDGIQEISDWDERGKAFALWRQVDGLYDNRSIFRMNILIGPDLKEIRGKLGNMNLDSFSSNCVLRLVRGWFPYRTIELFLDEQGNAVEGSMEALCRLPYKKPRDINLGGDRSQAILDIMGRSRWVQICNEVATKAIETVRSDQETISVQAHAGDMARKHFAMTMSRLKSRSQRTVEEISSIEFALQQEVDLFGIVQRVIDKPYIEIDSMGLYILSEEPICPR